MRRVDRLHVIGFAPIPLCMSELTTDETIAAALATAAIEATAAGISLADASLPDTPLVFVNQAFCAMTGYSASELIGRNARLLQGPKTDPATAAQIASALAAEESISVEILNYRKDGTRFWNRLTIDPIRHPAETGPVRWYVAYSFDMSERRRLEEALEDSERRLGVILDTAADAIITMGGDNRIRDFNAAAEEIFGYRRAEIIGGRVELLLPQAQQSSHADYVARYLATGKAHIIGTRREVQGVRRDGSVVDLELGVSEVLVSGETLFTAVLRDITARKRSEVELRQAKAQAESAARAKADFLAAMSHEIRTPMNGVLGMADLLLDTPLNQEQRDYARAIVNAGTSLLTVLNDILDVSKLEAGRVTLHPTPFHLPTLIEEVLDLLRPQAREKGIPVHSQTAPPLHRPLLGDPVRIRQILLNLVGNAIKFTEQGFVSVDARAAPASSISGGQQVLVDIAITDTGIGIPEAARSKLFTRFFQVDGSIARQYGGTGLGLTICQQLTGLMGGAITVDSEVGKGSCFRVTLPLACAPADALTGTLPTSASVPANQDLPAPAASGTEPARLLLVEDNQTNRLFAATLLRRQGYSVDLAIDGVEAVEAAASRDFDLILMDLRMPEMDGFEATRRIRRLDGARGRVPIIALTAHAMAEAKESCLAHGMNGYIAKPLQRRELLGTVEAVLSDRHAPVETEPAPNAPLAEMPLRQTTPVIDDAAFDELVDSLMGDGLTRVLTCILEDLTGRLTRLQTLRDGSEIDIQALSREVHDLSSVAGTIGAGSVMKQATHLEHLCLDGVSDPALHAHLIMMLLADLKQAITELKDRIRTITQDAG